LWIFFKKIQIPPGFKGRRLVQFLWKLAHKLLIWSKSSKTMLLFFFLLPPLSFRLGPTTVVGTNWNMGVFINFFFLGVPHY
jgi:hypothetical protein